MPFLPFIERRATPVHPNTCATTHLSNCSATTRTYGAVAGLQFVDNYRGTVHAPTTVRRPCTLPYQVSRPAQPSPQPSPAQPSPAQPSPAQPSLAQPRPDQPPPTAMGTASVGHSPQAAHADRVPRAAVRFLPAAAAARRVPKRPSKSPQHNLQVADGRMRGASRALQPRSKTRNVWIPP